MTRRTDFYWRPHFKYYPTKKLLAEMEADIVYLESAIKTNSLRYYEQEAIEQIIHHRIAALTSIQKILTKRLGSIEMIESMLILNMLMR
jgi:hypothetical protein